jgi:hypothetical protein
MAPHTPHAPRPGEAVALRECAVGCPGGSVCYGERETAPDIPNEEESSA